MSRAMDATDLNFIIDEAIKLARYLVVVSDRYLKAGSHTHQKEATEFKLMGKKLLLRGENLSATEISTFLDNTFKKLEALPKGELMNRLKKNGQLEKHTLTIIAKIVGEDPDSIRQNINLAYLGMGGKSFPDYIKYALKFSITRENEIPIRNM